jgi:fumarate hydratase class II
MPSHEANLKNVLGYNPILVTSFNSIVSYEKAAEIAKLAFATKRPIIDVAKKVSNIDHQELSKLSDPKN